MNKIEKFLAALRTSFTDMERVFLMGSCYELFVILRTLYPDAEAWYSPSEGHVYVKVRGNFYDIRGRHLFLPEDLNKMTHRDGDRPHRWSLRSINRVYLTFDEKPKTPLSEVGFSSNARRLPYKHFL